MSVKTLITQEPRYLCEPTHSNSVQMQTSASYFFLVIIFHVVFVRFGRNSLEAYFNHLRRKVTQKLRREHFRPCFDRRQVRVERRRRSSDVQHLGTKKSIGS